MGLDEYADKMTTVDFLRQVRFLHELGYSEAMEPWFKRHPAMIDKSQDISKRLELAKILPQSKAVTDYISVLLASP